MADFSVSNLLAAQTIVNKTYSAPEMRMKPCPAFSLLSSNDNFLFQNVNALKQSVKRPINAYLLKRTKRTSGSAREFNHTGTLDDSMSTTLAWTTKADKTTISLKLLDDNIFSFNTVLANKLAQCAMNILEDKETEAIAYLIAQRATAQPTLKNATFNATNDAVEISLANKNLYFQYMSSVMRQNYFSGQLDVIADSFIHGAAEFFGAQGAGNSTNLGYQFQNKLIAESVELTDANYASGVALAMPKGTVGAINWIPIENRNGWGDYNDYTGGFGTFDFMGHTFALHGYASRTDNSANNGDSQDVTMEFELSLDSSYNKAPLSVIAGRTDSVIVEFAQLAA